MPTNYEEYSDVQLWQFYQKGDEQAGNALCQRYWIALYQFFNKSISGNREDVEDLVQETFLEALKSLQKGQFPRSFQAWLYKIAARVLTRWIKEKQKQGAQAALDAAPEDELGRTPFTESFPAPTMDQPEYGVIDNEFGDIRRRFECTLGRGELGVFQLRHNSNMTFAEIGQALGIKTVTAKVRYHRALKAFKAWLKKRYPDTYYCLCLRGFFCCKECLNEIFTCEIP